MTLIGKIFTILIFIMSLLFLGFSINVYQTHVDLKTAATDAKSTALSLRTQIKFLEKEKSAVENSLKREQVARAYALAALETQVTAIEQNLEEKTAQYTATQALANDLGTALKVAEETKKLLTVEVGQLRKDINNSQLATDTFFAKILTLSDEVNHLNSLKSQAIERETQLRNQVGRLASVVRRNGLDEFSDTADIPPALDGRVIAVRSDLLQISLGQDDGLRIGHHLDVYRGAVYLGRVKIRETHPSSAVCEIIPKFLKGQIRKDDNVITNLN